MKRRVMNSLLLLCAASASAQSPAAPADAPDGVTILKFSWHRVVSRQSWDAPIDSASSQTLEDPRDTLPSDARGSRLPSPIGRSSPSTSQERARVTRNTTTANTDQTAAATPSPSRGAGEYTYQVRIKNGGDRKIEAFDLEYLFVAPATGRELGRHRFRAFRRAEPGKSLTLTFTSAASPARVVSVADSGKERPKFEERIVVRCVAYSDGTVRWRAGGAESDCDALRAASRAQGR